MQMSEPELLKVRNFGKTSLKEVKNKLTALGLSLGINVEQYQ
ncbi:MAG: DNA-directed RNA polymerase subunit alpha C-terminal domain-containing protein [Planctomycetota bacterium]|nr:DNA-directed RNA polymerase subunit alpha C-terminal domain-containing protein [Planctomycetota bacterium]